MDPHRVLKTLSHLQTLACIKVFIETLSYARSVHEVYAKALFTIKEYVPELLYDKETESVPCNFKKLSAGSPLLIVTTVKNCTLGGSHAIGIVFVEEQICAHKFALKHPKEYKRSLWAAQQDGISSGSWPVLFILGKARLKFRDPLPMPCSQGCCRNCIAWSLSDEELGRILCAAQNAEILGSVEPIRLSPSY